MWRRSLKNVYPFRSQFEDFVGMDDFLETTTELDDEDFPKKLQIKNKKKKRRKRNW